MNIRAFELHDVNDCVSDFIQSFNSPPWNEKWSWERANEYINDVFNTPKFIGFVLFNDNENIAYALCFKKYWWNKDDRYKLHIELFFTKPAYQQKGYGNALLNHIENYAKDNGLGSIMLFTKKDKPSYRFYDRNGFVVIDNLPNMYKQMN